MRQFAHGHIVTPDATELSNLCLAQLHLHHGREESYKLPSVRVATQDGVEFHYPDLVPSHLPRDREGRV
jgi:hypothetical protein